MNINKKQDPDGFWRDIAVGEYAWRAEPDQKHHSENFDFRKVGAAVEGGAGGVGCL